MAMDPAAPLQIQVVGIECEKPDLVEPIRKLENFFVIRVVSPFEFYCVRKKDRYGAFVKSQTDNNVSMQGFYNQNENLEAEYQVTVENSKCYAVRDRATGLWHRVRVLKHLPRSKIVLVHFFDNGNKAYIPYQSLRQLDDQFSKWLKPVFRCHMYDIGPAKGKYNWAQTDIVKFQSMVVNEVFTGLPMSWTSKTINSEGDGQFIDVGLVLYPMTANPLIITDSINWNLVKAGIARCLGPMASTSTLLFLRDRVPSYKNAGSEKLALVEMERRHIRHSKMEDIGRNEEFEGEMWVQEDLAIGALRSISGYMPAAARNRLALVRFCFIEGPSNIWVHMEAKVGELRALEKDLQMEMEAMTEPAIPKFSACAPVCCKLKSNKERNYHWCRGVISLVNEKKKCAEVIFADYGNAMMVRKKYLRELPTRFVSIPAFAHRLHLHGIRPKAVEDLFWSEDVNIKFGAYVQSYEGDDPLYYVYRPLYTPDPNDVVYYDQIHQDLMFQKDQTRWVLAPLEPDVIKKPEELINVAMLQSHFISFAVEIKYEQQIHEGDYWVFSSISDDLVDAKEAELSAPKLDLEKYYGDWVKSLDKFYE